MWSYILDFENSQNPYTAKQKAIADFSKHCYVKITENKTILKLAEEILKSNIKELDALHIACAKDAGCKHFITVDDKLLKYKNEKIEIINPIDFIKIYEKGGKNDE